MGLLDGRRAVITGGGSGIGAATCRRMAEEGAAVAVIEVDGYAYQADVTDYDALAAAIADAHARMRGLTTLFNNAGNSNMAKVHEWELGEWERVVRLNLTG